MKRPLFLPAVMMSLLLLGVHPISAAPQDQNTTNDAKGVAKDASKSTEKEAKKTAKENKKAADKAAKEAKKGADKTKDAVPK